MSEHQSSKVQIETDCLTLLDQLEDWDRVSPTFAEAVASALFIAATMDQAHQFVDGVRHRLTGVDRSTVIGWACGTEPVAKLRIRAVFAVHDSLKERHEHVEAERKREMESLYGRA